ncbi:hypothetical protein [Halopiger xanaduensis]|uniref:PGF-CTERM sorting domain-containing protein n=1 Tax=Halopiger xanaduensis (strain DSM 18323 / JCM 14033 / SH-6) TaxID=797210 RepID=F8D500_HALXS|nr:hypothetical protein [Halopiger xanaduensis]AEH38761.1 hypothetical protein Halxa_4157 [Halopiger xanaduensis SH-6]
MPTDTNSGLLPGRRSVRALGLAVLVVLSVLATSGLAGATQAQAGADTDDALESADELYLNDDGSGVLVYADDDNDVKEYQIGADVTEGLAHVLIADDVEDGELENAEGNVSAVLEDDMFSANGALTMEQPPEVEDLDVQISGEQSAETSEFDADVYALLGGGESGDIQQLSSTQQASLFESAETSGSIETTADTFRTSGNVSVDFGASSMATGDSPEETFAFDLTETETENGYEVAVSERGTEQAFLTDPAEQWGTEADAKATLEEQYSSLADDLGGDVTVEIDHHSFEEQSADTYWKELDYTITYEGIDDLEDNLADELADDSTADLDREEAEEIAGQVTNVEIETVQFDLTSSAEAMDATWTVEIGEYAPLLTSAVELSEASMEDELEGDDADQFGEQLEDFETRLEAQQAADLRSTFEWDASATYTDDNRVELEATATGDTENYDAYTDELADRGIDMSDERVVFEFNAATEDEQISVDGNVEIGTEDLAETALTSVADSIRQEQDAGQFGAFASALEESELEIAKVDLDFDNETVELEAGAKFNGTESLLEDGILGENVVLTQISGGSDEGATYVYVEDPDGEELDQDALAEQGLVDDDTDVYEPGEGDREFAEMDTEAATTYLGVDAEGGDGMPGFGPAAGLIGGAIAVALLAARRRV